jgi:hypothetical protein
MVFCYSKGWQSPLASANQSEANSLPFFSPPTKHCNSLPFFMYNVERK